MTRTIPESRYGEKVSLMDAPIRVLLIDDEELFLRNLALLLSRRGMAVQAASSGETALEYLSMQDAGFYDVIVLDFKMPVMDGLATLKAIRACEQKTPVILLTGNADVGQVSSMLKEGICEVLLKPCPVGTLVSTIENVHERSVIAWELSEPPE